VDSVLGIDVGKFDCQAAFLTEGKAERKLFANTAAGFARLDA
jgi:hypothetical protein